MTEEIKKSKRLQQVAVDLGVSVDRVIKYLQEKGKNVSPTTKVDDEIYNLLLQEFSQDKMVKERIQQVKLEINKKYSSNTNEKLSEKDEDLRDEEDDDNLLIRGTTLATTITQSDDKPLRIRAEKIIGPKIVGKIDLQDTKPKKHTSTTQQEASQHPSSPTLQTQTPIETPKIEKEDETNEKKQELKEKVDKITLNTENTTTLYSSDSINKQAITQKDEQTHISTIDTEKEQDTTQQISSDNFIKTEYINLKGPTIVGKIDLPSTTRKEEKKPIYSTEIAKQQEQIQDKQQERIEKEEKKKKRKRIRKGVEKVGDTSQFQKPKHEHQKPKEFFKPHKDKKFKPQHQKEKKVELSEEEIQKQIKETLARLSSATSKSKAAKYRKQKREQILQQLQEEKELQEIEKKTLRITEFITVSELATMMNVSPTQIISTCMALGIMVSINQRLDAETIVIVADEFGYKVEFISVEEEEQAKEEETPDNPEDLQPRPPIITVMGHVDHGKTSLLDYIRKTNVIAGEAGGITQHIGAYSVTLDNGKQITFLDTPGHEAFTAMRARGAKVTDIVIVVIAADDNVMPQTKEAISHAQAAGVPIIFAINKIDKPEANPDRIREQLAQMNILVEEWGGKYQCQEISAKKGINVDILLEKILLEAELLDLKANPKKLASGTVIESSLDKGRGYIATVLVQNGTLRVGDYVLAGLHSGRVKAMYNERNQQVKEAGPSTPVIILGLDGAPQAGDKFKVMEDEHEARAIALKRQQLQREQGFRTKKHITLDEIGRRIAIGNFKELNIIIKGDVDGSVEALRDSLMKLSTEKIQVNIIQAAVGQVSESDVLLAAASNAIIVAFQVRPSPGARRLAEQEQIDIRTYSIIYDAINEIKAAMEGMLSPEIVEKVVCNLEVKETFKISKVGTVAGCVVLDGKITKNTKIRVIRNGIVVYTGVIASLKRFKDDVKEVSAGQECGIAIQNYNDIKVGDIIEGYEETEVKAKL